MAKPSELMAAAPAASEPIPVYTGPTKTGTALIAAVAADTEKQTPPKRGKKSKIAAKKPDAAAPKAEAKLPAQSRPSLPRSGMRAPSRRLPPSRPLRPKEAGRQARRRQARAEAGQAERRRKAQGRNQAGWLTGREAA